MVIRRLLFRRNHTSRENAIPPVGAVYDRVNELQTQEKEHPLLSRGGVAARSRKRCVASKPRRRGSDGQDPEMICLISTTPSGSTRWLRTFFFMSRPPLLC